MFSLVRFLIALPFVILGGFVNFFFGSSFHGRRYELYTQDECLVEIRKNIKGIFILSSRMYDETGGYQYDVVCADMARFFTLMDENPNDVSLALVCSYSTVEVAELHQKGTGGHYDFLSKVYDKIVLPNLVPAAQRLLELNGGKPSTEEFKRVDRLFEGFDFNERFAEK